VAEIRTQRRFLEPIPRPCQPPTSLPIAPLAPGQARKLKEGPLLPGRLKAATGHRNAISLPWQPLLVTLFPAPSVTAGEEYRHQAAHDALVAEPHKSRPTSLLRHQGLFQSAGLANGRFSPGGDLPTPEFGPTSDLACLSASGKGFATEAGPGYYSLGDHESLCTVPC